MSSHQLDEERIFHLARRQPDADAQSEYLDQVCAGDQALRARVEALIEVYEKERSFLKSNGASPPTEAMSEIVAATGEQIGRYKLLQEIGEGGFGVVFMAEQHRPVRRKVALKVIKPGMDTKAVVARFEAERRPCQTGYMLAAEYYRLTRSIDDVEEVYKILADHNWTRFKLACLRASRGERVDWRELLQGNAEDDILAAAALSSELPIPDLSKAGKEYSPLTSVGVLLARQHFDEAKKLAENLLREIESFPSSETEKNFETLCLQNLVDTQARDEDFVEATDWPLQARFRLGLKHYALENYEVAATYFDEVIDSLHPEVYFNERAHWAMVLRYRIAQRLEASN